MKVLFKAIEIIILRIKFIKNSILIKKNVYKGIINYNKDGKNVM